MGSGGGWELARDKIVSCSADLSETCLDWFLVLTLLASSAELTFGPAKDCVVLVRAAAWAGENLFTD